MSRIYGNIGFKGLWNGLPVRIAMIGTLTVCCPPDAPPVLPLVSKLTSDYAGFPVAHLRQLQGHPRPAHNWRTLEEST